MKYCTGCGIILDNDDVFCKRCGKHCDASVKNLQDTGSAGWGVLGFLFPLVGLILFLVWKNDQPKNAKSAGIGALINACSGILSVIVFLILSIMLFIV